MRELVFLLPDERLPVPVDEVTRIVAELELLERHEEEGDDTRPPRTHRYDPRGVGERLERALELGRDADPLEVDAWNHVERQALARALDHLRNASPHFPPPLISPAGAPLLVLRDAMLAAYQFGTIPYLLEPLIPTHDEVADRYFASYTGEYDIGDRLVYGHGEAFRVVGRPDSDDERERLVVEEFRSG